MRFLYVVRFHENGSKNNVKAYRTVAKSPKAASQKMHKKGTIVSVRKKRRIL